MSKRIVVAAALAGALVATTAHAADMGYGRQPYTVNQPLNAYSWAGPYLGGNLGYQWGSVTNSGARPSGFEGGIQGGYNWQRGPLVFGAEADLQGSFADNTFAPYKFSNPWFGTVRGRIGYAFANVLLYGTGGLALGGLRGERFGVSEMQTSAGWAAGLGAEFAFAPQWSAKVEYLYVSLSDSRFSFDNLNHGYSFGTIRAGVNYHF